MKYLIVNSDSNVTEVNSMLKKENVTRPIYIFTKAQILEDFVGVEHHKEVPMPATDMSYYRNEYLGDMLASIRQIRKKEEDILNRINEHKLTQ